MKKFLTFLLCLALGLSMIACGTVASRTPVATRNASSYSSASEKTTTETEPTTAPADKDVLPQNADLTDSGFSFFGTYIGYIELGSYPQTIAHHKAVAQMSATSDARGYYLSTYDNCYYARISKSKVYGKRIKFSEDSLIKEGVEYYFKVEPVKWYVFIDTESLVSEGNTITLISDMILDSHAFCESYERNVITDAYYRTDEPSVYANNWGYSELRSWLNNDLLKKIFTAAEESKLLSRDTKLVSPIFKEGDETEKIWVPSSLEMKAYQNILSTLPASTQKHYTSSTSVVTDYARCKNTFVSIYPDYYGCGRYWTTTPGNNSYRSAFVPCDLFDNSGSIGESVGATYMGVRPVIRLLSDDVGKNLIDEVEE